MTRLERLQLVADILRSDSQIKSANVVTFGDTSEMYLDVTFSDGETLSAEFVGIEDGDSEENE